MFCFKITSICRKLISKLVSGSSQSTICVYEAWNASKSNPTLLARLTSRCRTLKVPKVGTFSWYLRVTTFWGFKIYTQNYMTLRDFDNFFFFAWILCFLCASLHATDFVKKWCKTKWSCFYIIIWAFVILRDFCVKKIIFHNFYVLFPDWYIHETIYNLIFISFMFVSRLIHPRILYCV